MTSTTSNTGIATNDSDKDVATVSKRPRRMARAAQPAEELVAKTKAPSKLDQVAALLLEGEGTTIAAIMAATGWQQHSVRGAMAGALKKRGLTITSEKVDGTRRYRASESA